MKKNEVVVSMGVVLGLLVLSGCSSSPSRDELKQLETTRAEIASLTQKESALRQEKATLLQAINEKQAKLKTCQDDVSSVQMKLKNTN